MHASGFQPQQLATLLHQIPLLPPMKEALHSLHAAGHTIRIVSDANTFYINTILEGYQLTDLIDRIVTNPSQVQDDGRTANRLQPRPKPPYYRMLLQAAFESSRTCLSLTPVAFARGPRTCARLALPWTLSGHAKHTMLETEWVRPFQPSSRNGVSYAQGDIVEPYLAEDFKRVVYIGDGGNDICPSLRLRRLAHNPRITTQTAPARTLPSLHDTW
jgi:hypothetical protein